MNATCYQCGARTQTDGAFRQERLPFRLRLVFYCHICWTKRQSRLFPLAAGLAIITVLALACAVVAKAGSIEGLVWVLLNLTIICVFVYLLTLAHELGHACCALLVGWRVFSLVLGSRHTIFQCRLPGIRIHINALPAGGLVRVAPKTTAYCRSRYFLIVLAGPCVNLAGFAAIRFLHGPI